MATLKNLHPSGILTQPDLGLPGFLENLFVRIFFEPRAKEAIGWIGMAYRMGPVRCWTFRVRGRPGVYSLTYCGNGKDSSGWHHGFFHLQYFPMPDEKVLNLFSVGENLLRLDTCFDQWIRTVPEEGDHLDGQFTVGRIILSFDIKENTVVLTLQAPGRWRDIRRDGLYLTEPDGSSVEAVSPGGTDRNVPAFALSWPFFDRLILTLRYLLKQAPLCVILKRKARPVMEIMEGGSALPYAGCSVMEYILSIGFGAKSRKGGDDDRVKWIINFLPSEEENTPNEPPEVIWSVTPWSPHPRRGNPAWWKIPKGTAAVSLRGFQSLGIHYRPPLLVVTGFLGSGKTTLLNQILEYMVLSRHKFVAVIQNEVGQVDVDGKLVDNAFRVTSLKDGCVCCTLLGDFRHAIRRICIEYEPDMIILETTGVADPCHILAELPDLEPLVRFDSLVCVIDGPNLRPILKDYPAARSQIEWAHLIVMNKTDLMEENALEEAMQSVQAINPKAPVLCTTYAQLNPGLLFSADEHLEVSEMKTVPVSLSSPDFSFARIRACTIQMPGILGGTSFRKFLNHLPDLIYRIKGVVRIKGGKCPQLLQYVAHRFELTNFTDGNIEPNTLVFIGRNLEEDALRESFKKCLAKE
ncbi:MAG TPA: CobW family GTP-binding protein [Syntrophales bacterium]|nr:CobW family GTP-binding protein [Syntrophales bacterium]